MSVRESFSIKQIKNPSAKAVWGIYKEDNVYIWVTMKTVVPFGEPF